MCNCNQKKSSICDTLVNTNCVVFTGDVSTKSDLCACGDYKMTDVVGDLYGLIDSLNEVSIQLQDNCLVYDKDEQGQNNLQDVLTKHSDLLCSLKTSVDLLVAKEPEVNLTGLDISCLSEDPCYEGDPDLKTVLQLIINKICNV